MNFSNLEVNQAEQGLIGFLFFYSLWLCASGQQLGGDPKGRCPFLEP